MGIFSENGSELWQLYFYYTIVQIMDAQPN